MAENMDWIIAGLLTLLTAGLSILTAEFLKECGKKLAGWLWDQAPDAVNKWLEKIYGFFPQEDFSCLLIGLVLGVFIVAPFMKGFFPQEDFSCCLLIGLVLGVFIVAPFMKGFFPQGYFSSCLLIGLVLGVFIVARFMKAKMACQNEPLNSQIRIANQGEYARPSTGQTRTTDAHNDVNFPTGNETPSPEDRNTSQNENESPSPVQSDASETIDGGNLPKLKQSPSPKENERSSPGQSDAIDTTNREICDIIILHTEDHKKEAYEFKNHLKSVLTLNDLRVDVIDAIGVGHGKLSVMDDVLKNYRLVFLYLSADLNEDQITKFLSELSIVESLANPANLGRVIPIWPSEDIRKNVKLPSFITVIKGIQYYDYADEQCKSNYIKIINDLVLMGREKYLKD